MSKRLRTQWCGISSPSLDLTGVTEMRITHTGCWTSMRIGPAVLSSRQQCGPRPRSARPCFHRASSADHGRRLMIQPSAPLLRNLVFLLCLTFAWFAPRFGDRFFSAIERLGWRLAGRKTVAIVSLVLATIVIRLSLIWLIPPPVPRIEDEFSYLLAGDTYAHGRLTNPD